MRFLFILCALLSSPSAFADAYLELYNKAGWAQQQTHFTSALQDTQQRYQNTLPSGIYQTLVDNSNRRFAAAAMQQRAQQALRQHLSNPQPALAFFESSFLKFAVAVRSWQRKTSSFNRWIGTKTSFLRKKILKRRKTKSGWNENMLFKKVTSSLLSISQSSKA